MPKVKMTLSIGFANCERMDIIEIDDVEWTDCETNEEKGLLLHEYWHNWAHEYIDGGFEIIE